MIKIQSGSTDKPWSTKEQITNGIKEEGMKMGIVLLFDVENV
jgi:hypothetical protein